MPIKNFTHRVDWIEFTEINGRKAGIPEDAQVQTITKKFLPDIKKVDGIWTVLEIDVELGVNKAESWVVKGKKTEELLKHEQGHYNIAALGARDMYNKVKALTGKSGKAVMEEAKKVMKQVQGTIVTKDDLYDTQTNHGNFVGSQLKWDKNIQGQMGNLKGSLDNLS